MASRLSITDEFLALAKVASEAKTKVELELMVTSEVFGQILGEIRSLVGILFELHIRTIESAMTDVQKERIQEIQADCRHVLADTEHTLSEESSNLFSETPWDEPNEVAQVRECITSIISALDEAITRPNCEVLDWLVPNEYNTKVQSDHMSKRATGTYQWFFDSPDYETWTSRKGEQLFYYGDIGVGKSVLASTVIASLQESYTLANNVATCYFYYDSIRTKEQSIDHVMLAMLWMLIRRMLAIPEPVLDLFKRHEKEHTRPTSDEVRGAFCSVASSFSRVFIIIDGLDDCRLSEGCHKDIMSALLLLQAQTGANMFVTSRTMPRITEASSGHRWAEFRASDEDIAQFARANMYRMPKTVRSKYLRQNEIVRDLVRYANGVFLHAELRMDSLAETGRWKDSTYSRKSKKKKKSIYFDESLTSTLENMGSIYKNTWQRINSQRRSQRELAVKTLVWVLYVQRPLTTIELQHALSIQVDESTGSEIPIIEDVVWSCCGLLAIDQELDQVRLVHHTATEYFMAMAEHGEMSIKKPGAMITDSCLTYLSYNVFGSGECRSDVEFQERLASHPFYDYASNYWGHHDVSTDNLDRVRSFLRNSSLVEASSQALFSLKRDQDDHGYSQRTPKGLRNIHLSAIFGLSQLLQGSDGLWQGDDCGIDTPVSNGRTLLSYAAEHNQDALAHILFDKGAKIDCQDDELETPLSQAAMHGHLELVRLFLSQWPSFQDTDIYQNAALLHAAARGHAPVVRFLLDQHGCYGSTQWESNGKEALRRAESKGLNAVVRLLLKTWARVELQDKRKPIILSYAIENEHHDSVQLLSSPQQWNTYMLEKLSSLVVENRSDEIVKLLRCDSTILPSVDVYIWAINNQHLETILLLLERGPCQRFGEVVWEKILLAAIEKGDLALTRVILNFARHLISWRDELGRTVLFYACDFGKLVIVDVLLDKYDADGNAQCTLGRSPLLSAAYVGRFDVVNSLLSRQEIKVETIDYLGRGILSIASEAGESSLVKRLLERSDIDPDSSDNLRRTPLSWAAAGGHSRIIKHLVRTDLVDVNYADTDGRTPIFWACHQGHQEAMLHLLDAACDTTIRDKSGQTAMHAAAKNGSDAMCKMLLGKVDLDVFDHNQNTALMLALDNEHHKVVRLLQKNADVSLCFLAKYGQHRQLQLLLEKGSNVNTADGQGRSLLILSVIHQQGSVLRLLIKNNADVTLADGDGLGPLEHAVQISDCDSIHELLRAGSDTTMISASQWYSAFSKQNDHLMLTQEQDGQKTIAFHPPSKPPLWPDSSHPGLRRRLIVTRNLILQPQSTSKKSGLEFLKLGHKEGHKMYRVLAWYSPEKETEHMSSKRWSYSIEWTLKKTSTSGINPWSTIEHRTTLPIGSVPHDGLDFFQSLVNQIVSDWSDTCTQANKQLTGLRQRVFRARGTDLKLIDDLLMSAHGLFYLRQALDEQVESVVYFRKHYCTLFHRDRLEDCTRIIRHFSGAIGQQLDRLDQLSQSIIQIEFNLVSIREARESTSMSASMKRLSWITFIFLPAMFVSSIFGMNVDILANNPDWRWYLLFVSICLLLTFLGWVVFKYCNAERWIYLKIGRPVEKRTERFRAERQFYDQEYPRSSQAMYWIGDEGRR